MGCGSSKVLDVPQPVPVYAETDGKETTDVISATTRDVGENRRLQRKDNVDVSDVIKHIDDDKAQTERRDVSEGGFKSENGQNVEGKETKKQSNEITVKGKGTYNTSTTSKSGKESKSNAKDSIIATNKSGDRFDNAKNNVLNRKQDLAHGVQKETETSTESATKQTGKEPSTARSSLTEGENKQADFSGTLIYHGDREKNINLADDSQGVADPGSTGKHIGDKLKNAKSSVISANKNSSDVNSNENNDRGAKKVTADDAQVLRKEARREPLKRKLGSRQTPKVHPDPQLKVNERSKRREKTSVIGQPKWRHDYDIPVVDPEEGLGDLPDIYKDMEQPVKIEDTFWPGKRKVIPDFQVMRDIDKHALAAPQNIKTNLKQLVQYLVRPAKNELEKYRSIARCIGENIAYDTDAYFSGSKNSPSDPQGVLTKGAAVCAGYSKLFQAMCKEVDLECEIITGKAKGVGYTPGSDGYENHSWNKIVIGNNPYLCDVTWGAGAVGADQKFKRLWKEHEFLSEPVSFSQSRLPVDLQNNNEVNESAQLCEKPYKSLKTWADLPHYGNMLQAAGATVSPNKGTIDAKGNEGEVRISLPRLLRVYTTLKAKSKRSNLKENHVMISWEGNTAVLRFALPGPGKYQLSVIARFVSAADKESEELYGKLVGYCINATGTQSHPPFHIEHGYYGNNPYVFLKGYQCLSHDQPVIETNSYRLVMQFACPDRGKAFFRLLDASRRNPKEEKTIENSLYVDKFPNKYACYIFLPKPGNYLLQHLTINEPGKDQYQVRATYIIKFKGKTPTITAPFPKHTDWGTRKFFHDCNLQLTNIRGSTIRLTGGEGLLSFYRPFDSKKEILTNVVTMEDKVPPDSRDWAIVTKDKIASDTEQVNVTVTLPKSGFYGLNLFVDRQFAGRFLISSDAKATRSHPEKG